MISLIGLFSLGPILKSSANASWNSIYWVCTLVVDTEKKRERQNGPISNFEHWLSFVGELHWKLSYGQPNGSYRRAILAIFFSVEVISCLTAYVGPVTQLALSGLSSCCVCCFCLSGRQTVSGTSTPGGTPNSEPFVKFVWAQEFCCVYVL